MAYYFLFTTASGQILAANTTGFTPGTGEAVLGPLSSADTNAVVAYQYPQRFLVQGSPAALVEQPWWEVAVTPTSTANQYTLTATLENPPNTPPSTATLTLAGGSLSGAVSSNQVAWTVALHPSVTSQQITATVSASGTVSGSAVFGGTAQQIGLQLVTTQSPPLVAPAGTSAPGFLATYHLGLSPDQADVAMNLMTIISTLDSVIATNPSITPPASWSQQQMAHAKWKHDQTTIPHL